MVPAVVSERTNVKSGRDTKVSPSTSHRGGFIRVKEISGKRDNHLIKLFSVSIDTRV
jgi:hypothetical protein